MGKLDETGVSKQLSLSRCLWDLQQDQGFFSQAKGNCGGRYAGVLGRQFMRCGCGEGKGYARYPVGVGVGGCAEE